MAKQILLELDESLISEATAVFDYFGLDIQTGIKMFLTRAAKDKTVSFLFGQTNQSFDKLQNKGVVNEDITIENSDLKMTKNSAKRLFMNNGYEVYQAVTFASKNRSANNYWANPNFDLLNKDWSLILNDNKKHKLYLFNIPANTINKELTARADIPELIDLQIMYNDITFTDNRSGFSFSKFLIDKITY